jgi:hypothetical protein
MGMLQTVDEGVVDDHDESAAGRRHTPQFGQRRVPGFQASR